MLVGPKTEFEFLALRPFSLSIYYDYDEDGDEEDDDNDDEAEDDNEEEDDDEEHNDEGDDDEKMTFFKISFSLPFL